MIVDVSDPAAPTRLGGYDTPGSAYGVTLSSDGTKAYVADMGGGVVTLDVSNPLAPILLNIYHTNALAYGIALSSDGTKAYIADTTVDTRYIARNFGNDAIRLKIDASPAIDLSLSVTADIDDIVTVESYPEHLTYSDYNGTFVEIPLSSLPDKTGRTILTVHLTHGSRTLERKMYLSIY